MIELHQSLTVIQVSEFILLVTHLSLMYIEFKSLKKVLRANQTLSLIGFLFLFAMMRISRIVGIYTSNLLIRTYLTALLSIIAIALFINWGSIIIGISVRVRMIFYVGLFIPLFIFIYSREMHYHGLESIILAIMIGIANIFMFLIFRFVFKTSPYYRSRHRLFLLTLSFFIYIIFEGLAVTSMGTGDYISASIFLLLTLPPRCGITISIILPDRLVEFLKHIIK